MRTKKKQRPVFSLIDDIHPQFPRPGGIDSPPAPEPVAAVQVRRDQPVSGSAPPDPPDSKLSPQIKSSASQLRAEPVPTGDASGGQPASPPETYPDVAGIAPGWTGGKPSPLAEAPSQEDFSEEIPPPVRPESPPAYPDLAGDSAPETGPPAEGKVPPRLQLEAASHNFGRLLVGQRQKWELDISNEGDDDLLITGLDGLPASGFELIKPPLLPVTITPRGALQLTIQFAPDSCGVQKARLYLHSQPIPSFIPEITLTGTGSRVFSTEAGLYYSPLYNPLGMGFVYIQEGTFFMGSHETEPGRRSDELRHEISITKPFYLQSTPVTQKQWQAIMGNNPSKFSEDGDNRPVEGVTWNACQEFIKRLNSRGEGLYRLPTEAEWEYACRAGSLTAFANGNISKLFCDHDPNLDAMGWFCYNAANQTHPVGLKSANSWGLYDMHGNISEWCQDWYGEYGSTGEADPQGPPVGTEKVVRGGSWFASAKNCRSASRFKWPPHSRTNLQVIGFRLLREV